MSTRTCTSTSMDSVEGGIDRESILVGTMKSHVFTKYMIVFECFRALREPGLGLCQSLAHQHNLR